MLDSVQWSRAIQTSNDLNEYIYISRGVRYNEFSNSSLNDGQSAEKIWRCPLLSSSRRNKLETKGRLRRSDLPSLPSYGEENGGVEGKVKQGSRRNGRFSILVSEGKSGAEGRGKEEEERCGSRSS